MGDLPVAANDKFTTFVPHLLQVVAQQLVKFGFAGQLFRVAGLCLGREQAAHAEILVIGLDIAPLHVEVGEAQPGHDCLG